MNHNIDRINGWTRDKQCQQVFYFIQTSAVIGLFSAVVFPPILQWQENIMLAFAIIFYALFLNAFIIYLILTCKDPIDLQDNLSQGQSKVCELCKRRVEKQTYHCLTCNRCTARYDHHSQLVNNCISMNDSGKYIVMNFSFCLGMVISMSQSLTLFIMYHSDPTLSDIITNKWPIMAVFIISFVNFMFSFYSSIFSCYLRYVRNMTRFHYKFRDTDSNKSDSDEDMGDQKEISNR